MITPVEERAKELEQLIMERYHLFGEERLDLLEQTIGDFLPYGWDSKIKETAQGTFRFSVTEYVPVSK